ncbi:MAG: hypothetical protein DSZ12_03435, partial [Sulfurovum sp.]
AYIKKLRSKIKSKSRRNFKSKKIRNKRIRNKQIQNTQVQDTQVQNTQVQNTQVQNKKIKNKKIKNKKYLGKKAKNKTVHKTIPKAPKKNIKLKKVEDNNYSSGYMYPGASKRKSANVPKRTTLSVMTRAECISMIGQAKFDKYTQMFGNENASLKRCSMLRASK